MKNLNFLMAAYILAWAIFFVYQATVAQRVAALRGEVERLKESLRRK